MMYFFLELIEYAYASFHRPPKRMAPYKGQYFFFFFPFFEYLF